MAYCTLSMLSAARSLLRLRVELLCVYFGLSTERVALFVLLLFSAREDFSCWFLRGRSSAIIFLFSFCFLHPGLTSQRNKIAVDASS